MEGEHRRAPALCCTALSSSAWRWVCSSWCTVGGEMVRLDEPARKTPHGVSDGELSGLRLPVAVLPSAPVDPFHQRHTADALLGSVELPGCLEPPRPEFPSYLDSFAAEL